MGLIQSTLYALKTYTDYMKAWRSQNSSQTCYYIWKIKCLCLLCSYFEDQFANSICCSSFFVFYIWLMPLCLATQYWGCCCEWCDVSWSSAWGQNTVNKWTHGCLWWMAITQNQWLRTRRGPGALHWLTRLTGISVIESDVSVNPPDSLSKSWIKLWLMNTLLNAYETHQPTTMLLFI